MADRSPIHLVKGDDPVLVGQGARDLVDRLVGDAERNEVLTEFGGDDYTMGDVTLAASTVSMFGGRVVVARNAGRFVSADLAGLLAYLADPAPDSVVVLVWEAPVAPGARTQAVPKALTDAVKAAGGEVHSCSLPGGKGRGMWADDQMDAATVRLSPRARRTIVERLGEDLSRLGGILTVLDATFGDRQVDVDDIAPYLGDAGGVPPWDLTDAIDKGDVSGALVALRRLLGNGSRHPLQVMVTLQTHVERMLRLDGAGVRDEAAAAALLGMKKGSTFPAKKAMQQGAKLGSAKIARATALVAAADLDLHGRTAQDPVAVLETLVARLAALSAGRPAGRSGGRAAARAR